MRHRLVLALLLTAEAAALALAWTRIPSPAPVDAARPLEWLRHTDPETATLVVGRVLATAVAGWLLATTLLATIARVALVTRALPRAMRPLADRAGRLAPAAVRHVVEAAVAVGVVAAATHPAVAATGTFPEPRRPAAVARPLVAPLTPVRDGRAAPVPAPPPPPVAPAPTGWGHHRVVDGEHLWGIADAVVRAHRGADDPAAVDRYWRALCDANRGHLASGDPDVVLPGEDLDLPPVA